MVGLRLASAIGAMLLMAPCTAQLLSCLAHPVEPPCCPSPCPIADAKRLPELASAVTAVQQLVAIEQETADTARMLQQTVGMAVALPADFTTVAVQAARDLTQMPAALAALPASAMQSVKQSLFQAPGAVLTSSQETLLRQSRAAALSQEQVAAFVVGLQQIGMLPAVPPISAPAAAMASQSASLRGDTATAGGARLTLLADIASIAKLWAVSDSLTAIAAARKYEETAVSVSAPPSSDNDAGFAASPIGTPMGFFDTLPAQRIAAQSILSSYPALQDTIAAAKTAQTLANAAARGLQGQLQDAGFVAPDSLATVQALLRKLDATSWQDSAIKDQVASASAAKVSAALMPSQGGGVSDPLALSQAMSAWLAADKQNRYWRSLAASASTSIAALDRRLGEISDSVGADITSVTP
jgi:hypothetical protein